MCKTVFFCFHTGLINFLKHVNWRKYYCYRNIVNTFGNTTNQGKTHLHTHPQLFPQVEAEKKRSWSNKKYGSTQTCPILKIPDMIIYKGLIRAPYTYMQ